MSLSSPIRQIDMAGWQTPFSPFLALSLILLTIIFALHQSPSTPTVKDCICEGGRSSLQGWLGEGTRIVQSRPRFTFNAKLLEPPLRKIRPLSLPTDPQNVADDATLFYVIGSGCKRKGISPILLGATHKKHGSGDGPVQRSHSYMGFGDAGRRPAHTTRARWGHGRRRRSRRKGVPTAG